MTKQSITPYRATGTEKAGKAAKSLSNHWSWVVVFSALMLAIPISGCTGSPGKPQAAAPELYVAPLPVQQAQAYPETVTKRFVSLADFELSGGAGSQGPAGDLAHFSFRQLSSTASAPDAVDPSFKLVVNNTRTGAGAIEVLLPPKTQLQFDIPQIHDFTGYALLSLALYSESLRDDLRVTITSDGASWTSLPTLIQSGWNTVLIDIRRLEAMKDFDIKGVRSLKLQFVDAAGPVMFNLDDVMLIDNRRTLAPTPEGLALQKNALDYVISLNGLDKTLQLSQAEDGLWRLGQEQPLVQIVPPGQDLSAEDAERLAAMGSRRVGKVEVVENNAIRLRMVNTWYFPTRAGEWASLAVRQIRWEHTFYGKDRYVTHLELNNAGGGAIGALRIRWPQLIALSGQKVQHEFELADMSEVVKRWNYLTAWPDTHRQQAQQNFLQPGKVVLTLGVDELAPGDIDRNGFDESQGCYYLKARNGHCRFRIEPPAGGLVRPVFRVQGGWDRLPGISCEGLAIRRSALLQDGSVLFMLDGLIQKPTFVEVAGPKASPEESAGIVEKASSATVR